MQWFLVHYGRSWVYYGSWIFSKLVYIWVFPKHNGIPKWMVKIMENPIKMDDLGGPPTPIFGNTHMFVSTMDSIPEIPMSGAGWSFL